MEDSTDSRRRALDQARTPGQRRGTANDDSATLSVRSCAIGGRASRLCRAHGELARTSRSAGQQQVGQIGAGDQEHRGNGAEEHQQGRTDRLRPCSAARACGSTSLVGYESLKSCLSDSANAIMSREAWSTETPRRSRPNMPRNSLVRRLSANILAEKRAGSRPPPIAQPLIAEKSRASRR